MTSAGILPRRSEPRIASRHSNIIALAGRRTAARNGFPKGRYKLVPSQKQSRLSMLRARSRRNTRLLSTLQVSTVDGDTIRVGTDRIRLRGIDTPELTEPEGQAAKQRLEALLRSGPVRLVPRGRDIYDRLVADVFVNDQNVAEVLKSEGFARAE